MEWQCPRCTLINVLITSVTECAACGAERAPATPSVGFGSNQCSNPGVACPTCTFLNFNTKYCEICNTQIPMPIKSVILKPDTDNGGASDDDEYDSDDPDVSARKYLLSHFTTYVEEIILHGNKTHFKCRKDSAIFSTKNIMLAYLLKKYPPTTSLMAQDKAIPAPTVDYGMALQLAMDDFEKQESQQQHVHDDYASKSKTPDILSPSKNLKLMPSIYDKRYKDSLMYAPKDSHGEAKQHTSKSAEKSWTSKLSNSHVVVESKPRAPPKHREPTLEELEAETATKQERLQKLLSRMDKIVQSSTERMTKLMGASNLQTSDSWTDGHGNTATLSNKLNCLSSSSSGQQPKLITGGQLRDYQLGGVEWLNSLHLSGLKGMMLSDEMGLGKTIQVISFLCMLHERHSIWGPHLVIVPLSVMSAWTSDIAKFCPAGVHVHCHYGDKLGREETFRSWYKLMKTTKNSAGSTTSSSSSGSTDSLPSFFGSKDISSTSHQQAMWKVSIVLTTYDIAIKDARLFQMLHAGASLQWQYLVIDEAHRLKNQTSVLHAVLSKLEVGHRLLLTGTPLQNNLTELWSLVSFMLPDVFTNLQQFSDWFNKPFEIRSDDENDDLDDVGAKQASVKDRSAGASSDTATSTTEESISPITISADSNTNMIKKPSAQKPVAKLKRLKSFSAVKQSAGGKKPNEDNALTEEERSIVISSLHRILKPFLLRRVKSDVLTELPAKIEREIKCPQSALQMTTYSMLKSSVQQKQLNKDDDEFTEFGEAASTSWANKGSSVSFNNVVMQLRKLCNHPYLVLEDMQSIPDSVYDEFLVCSSGKMCVLERLLKILLHDHHKVLIFSQLTTTLDIIQGFLYHMKIACARLDGSIAQEERLKQLHKFHTDKDCKVFLLSTRAGGVGINLQAADTVILFDSDWNPQQDLQAMSRAHRLGQPHTVLVLRLITAGHNDVSNCNDTATDDNDIEGACIMTEYLYFPSIEERMLKRAAQKLENEQAIIGKGNFDMGTATVASATTSTARSSEFMKEVSFKSILQQDLEPVAGCKHSVVDSLFSNASDQQQSQCEGAVTHAQSEINTEYLIKCCRRDGADECDQDSSDRDYGSGGSLSEQESSLCNEVNKHCSELLRCVDMTVWGAWLGSMSAEVNDSQQIESVKLCADVDGQENGMGRGRQRKRSVLDAALSLNEDELWFNGLSEEDKLAIGAGRRSRRAVKTTTSAEPDKRTLTRRKPKQRRQKTISSCQPGHDTVDLSQAQSDEDDNNDNDDTQVDEADICLLCDRPWLTHADIEAITQSTAIVSTSASSCCDETRNTDEYANIMIICDGCNSSFHLFCAGLTSVPEGDWHCQWCHSADQAHEALDTSQCYY